MFYYEVIPLKIVHAAHGVLTYQSPTRYTPGTIVSVPVGKSSVVGIIVALVDRPAFACKEISAQHESVSIPQSLLQLGQWLAEYYATHPVLVWQTILPRGLHKTRRKSLQNASHPSRYRTHIVLNKAQTDAVERIMSDPSGTSLLHGVTGSGKTQVYIELAKQTVAAGRSVILLVPEIALTSQLIAEFTPHFPELKVTHSTMTESTRHQVWQSLLHAQSPQVVIGPRSALFSPVPNLGLIVIDECHEPSFKQEQSPRYSALRGAAMLARFADARLVLGSATPNVTDYYLATTADAPIVRLDRPARTDTVAPTVTLVDMTKKLNFTRSSLFSNDMIAAMQHTIEAGHQVLLFHNRRGTAPMTLCESCGWSALCDRCFVPMTLHGDRFELRCHICDAVQRVPTACPSCGEAQIIHKGIGTKLIHESVAKLFPRARIERFDGDSDQDATLDKQYQALHDGDIDIIIGTQVVAKGLDLPHLRMVGVVQADAGLALPDYLSSERTFQLLAQVTGRVGRNEHPSTVVVQSYQPSHPAVQYGITSDYMQFYELTLAERQRAKFPPYTHLLKLVCVYKTESEAIRAAQQVARDLRSSCPSRVEFLGPTPAFYERVRDSYRWQIVVKSPVRKDLVDIIAKLPAQHWQFELDPGSLL
jgi:primosomal protein N' (replication factor Y)